MFLHALKFIRIRPEGSRGNTENPAISEMQRSKTKRDELCSEQLRHVDLTPTEPTNGFQYNESSPKLEYVSISTPPRQLHLLGHVDSLMSF
jgi:hypothetical protein